MTTSLRAPGESTIRVLVADNSGFYTRLLADALTRDSILEVIPFEGESSELVATAIKHDIDVLLISSTLDERPSRGIELLRELRTARPKTRSVLLPESSKDEAVLQAFQAGARGIFGRNESMELLSRCVRCVYQGQIWASGHDIEIAINALANSPNLRTVNASGMNLLSERELQVVRCLAEGLTNREIAERLELSQHTVKNYFFRIFDKLGVSSRVELLFMSMSHAAIEPASMPHSPKDETNGNKDSHYESDLLKKSAEAGLPAAQLALAQMYLARRAGPQDVIDGYKWYLIATECAMQARGFISKMLTVEQIEEGKHKAGLWLAKRKQKLPSSASSTTKQPRQAGFPSQKALAQEVR